MEDVAEHEGRTVLFVSHQMAAIENLCSRAILLNSGQVVLNADTQTTISKYLESLDDSTRSAAIANMPRSGNGKVKLTDFWIEDAKWNAFSCGCFRQRSGAGFFAMRSTLYRHRKM